MPGLPTDEKPSKRHRLRLIFWKLTGLEGCFSWAPALTSSAPSTNKSSSNFTKPSRSKSSEIITSILKRSSKAFILSTSILRFPAVAFHAFQVCHPILSECKSRSSNSQEVPSSQILYPSPWHSWWQSRKVKSQPTQRAYETRNNQHHIKEKKQ